MTADTKTHFFEVENSGETFRPRKVKPDFKGKAFDVIDTLHALVQRPIPSSGTDGPRSLIFEFDPDEPAGVKNVALYNSKADVKGGNPLECGTLGSDSEELCAIIVISKKLDPQSLEAVVHLVDPHLDRLTDLAGIYFFEERQEGGLDAKEKTHRQKIMLEFALKEETLTVIDDPHYWYTITEGRVGEKWDREPWKKNHIEETYQSPLFREDGKKGKYVFFTDDPVGDGRIVGSQDIKLLLLVDQFRREAASEPFPAIDFGRIEPIPFGEAAEKQVGQLEADIDIPWGDETCPKIKESPPRIGEAQRQTILAQKLGLEAGAGITYTIREVGPRVIDGIKVIEYSIDEVIDGVEAHNMRRYLPEI